MYRRNPQSESGYVLLAVLFMVVLILVALAIAAPRIATEIQRDREAELIHRGKQYTRAIKLYYLKFHNYPSSIDQLENTNNLRFLRKRYVDPITGKDDWKIIHFGEAHVKATGLFGQPIQNGGMPATAGGNVLGGASGIPAGGTPTMGSMTPTSSINSSSTNTSTSSTGTGTDSSGTATGTPGTTTPGSSSPFSSPSGSSSGLSGQTFGGGPMVGVVSKNTKASIKEYKKQKHYNEWEFVYDPVEDMLSSVSLFGGGSGPGGSGSLNGPGSGTNSGTPSTGFPTSNQPGGFPGINNPGSPVNPVSGPTPTPPTSPQQ